jgi:rubrerythrin
MELMEDLTTVDGILDFAIGQEQEAAAFYGDLAEKADSPQMKETFEQFAREERGHEAKLKAVKSGRVFVSSAEKVQDLKIGDYLVAPEEGEKLDYQGALILAMKKEKAAFRLYSDLAARTDDEGLKNLMLGLAQEEAKHKLRFEVEYDDRILGEN